LTLNFVSAIK